MILVQSHYQDIFFHKRNATASARLKIQFQDFICRQRDAIWVMQLVTAEGTGCEVSLRHDARASRASLGLQGARS